MSKLELIISDIDAFKTRIVNMRNDSFPVGITLSAEDDGTLRIRSRKTGRSLGRIDKSIACFKQSTETDEKSSA